MQAVTALAPLVAFFVTYQLRGLYVATAVLMGAMLVLLAVDWLRERRIPRMHGLSALLVLILGSATLLLHNRLFIQWKPTVFFWVIGAAFLASTWVSARTLTERLLAPALDGSARVSAAAWRRLNFSSAAFYGVLGALNLAVAYHASERTWVNFKFYALTPLTVAFLVLQALWLSAHTGEPRAEGAP